MRMNPFAMAIAAVLAIAFLLGAPARASIDFSGINSVRVSPNVTFEIRYIAGFSGDGKVEIFDNPDGTGTPIAAKVTGAPENDHTFVFEVNNTVLADTQYYFRVSHHDPNGGAPDEASQPPLPPVFTGVQAISGVSVVPGINSALISWAANVIGLGHVSYHSATMGSGAGTDGLNITDHAIELTGLSPGTTYEYRVSNVHAIDGGALVEQTGFFTTLGSGGVIPEPSAFMVWAGLALVGYGIHSKTSRKRA